MEEDVLYMVIVFVIQVIVGLLLNYATGVEGSRDRESCFDEDRQILTR